MNLQLKNTEKNI